MKNSQGISLIIHTKNEERNIKDCILSAKETSSWRIYLSFTIKNTVN